MKPLAGKVAIVYLHEKERLMDLYQKSIVTLEELEPRLLNIREKIFKIELKFNHPSPAD